ncbi:MAG: hypothetical protein DWQ37_21155 [Planctomycetota bacterium]|nr:MAG: hypothetical protein DWQ37_21155 [Planctomycetota bacterium]
MAITAVHYFLVRQMFERGILPQHGAILEIGEANMYGDVHAETIKEDIAKYVPDAARREALLKQLATALADTTKWRSFHVAKVYYEMFFSPSEMQAIDFSGTDAARKLDLNQPIELGRRFEVCFNHGTAEHIFNIAQVFSTIHNHTVPGGLMIHEDPFTGWIEHGFYNLQPTLFFDLADFNEYTILGMFIEDFTGRSVTPIHSREEVYKLADAKQIPENSSLFVVFRRGTNDHPFRVPMQGYYRRALPAEGVEAWKNLR